MLTRAKPLPKEEGIEFIFGCETEMDKFFRLGISRECIDRLDFVVVPTTHLQISYQKWAINVKSVFGIMI